MSATSPVTSPFPGSRMEFPDGEFEYSVQVGSQEFVEISYLATPIPFSPIYATSPITSIGALSVSSPASHVSTTSNGFVVRIPTPLFVPPYILEPSFATEPVAQLGMPSYTFKQSST